MFSIMSPGILYKSPFQCNNCNNLLRDNANHPPAFDFPYDSVPPTFFLDYVNCGGLTSPSAQCYTTVIVAYLIFGLLKKALSFQSLLFSGANARDLFCKFAFELCEKTHLYFYLVDGECPDGHSITPLFNTVCASIFNIFQRTLSIFIIPKQSITLHGSCVKFVQPINCHFCGW